MKYLKTYEEKKGLTFKEWLKDYPQDINTTEIQCDNENLIDLDGVQEFKNLKELSCCFNNNLTSLNLKGLDKLEGLDCSNNNLTSLNLEGLYKLEYLYCPNNNLTSLNLEGLDKLKTLSCYKNNLTSLNLEGLENLEYLYCWNNKLPYDNINEYWEWYQKEYPERWEARKFNF